MGTSALQEAGINPLLALAIYQGGRIGYSKGQNLIDTLKNIDELNSDRTIIKAQRSEFYNSLKKGVIDDQAWEMLNEYAEINGIDMKNIPWDEKMKMVEGYNLK